MHHAMKTWGSEDKAPCILNLGTRWRWVVNSTSSENNPQYPLVRRLGGPQGWSRHGKEKKVTLSTVVQPIA